MPEYGILNTEAHKDNDVPAKWSKTWPCLGALALQTCRSWPKFWTALSEVSAAGYAVACAHPCIRFR